MLSQDLGVCSRSDVSFLKTKKIKIEFDWLDPTNPGSKDLHPVFPGHGRSSTYRCDSFVAMRWLLAAAYHYRAMKCISVLNTQIIRSTRVVGWSLVAYYDMKSRRVEVCSLDALASETVRKCQKLLLTLQSISDSLDDGVGELPL